MTPRKRSPKNEGLPDNLYRAIDRRTKRYYYRYKDPRTGKYHGLGTDHRKAVDTARTLNAAIAQQIADTRAQRLIAGQKIITLSVSDWIKQYHQIQLQKLAEGEIKQSTVNTRKTACNGIERAWGNKEFGAITTKDCADLIRAYKDLGKSRMAQTIRAQLIDLFAEAIAAGEIDATNPALLTKQPIARTQRTRLTLEAWKLAREHAKDDCKPWIENAMLLALVTGQRLSDVGKMKFSDVKKDQDGEFLHIEQTKTGNKIRLPTSLRMESIGLSIKDVISKCRDDVISPYMLHHIKHAGMAKPGAQVRVKSLSNEFRIALQATGLEWEKEPPSFHEMRSLSEREYKAQGIDTKTLLGHTRQSTTDGYHDSRGDFWVTLEV